MNIATLLRPQSHSTYADRVLDANTHEAFDFEALIRHMRSQPRSEDAGLGWGSAILDCLNLGGYHSWRTDDLVKMAMETLIALGVFTQLDDSLETEQKALDHYFHYAPPLSGEPYRPYGWYRRNAYTLPSEE